MSACSACLFPLSLNINDVQRQKNDFERREMDCENVVLINKSMCSFLGWYPEQNKRIHKRKRIHTNSHRENRSPHIAQKKSKKTLSQTNKSHRVNEP